MDDATLRRNLTRMAGVGALVLIIGGYLLFGGESPNFQPSRQGDTVTATLAEVNCETAVTGQLGQRPTFQHTSTVDVGRGYRVHGIATLYAVQHRYTCTVTGIPPDHTVTLDSLD